MADFAQQADSNDSETPAARGGSVVDLPLNLRRPADRDRTTTQSAAYIDRRDLLFTLAIGALAFCYTIPGIFIREFYRHTEADRTLIGWEMLERGDFAVPHLLGDFYLTKPPVFYALIAGAIKIFGPSEWAARLVTVGAITLLLPLLYLFYRRSGLERSFSLLAVAITGLCGQMYEYSVIAEIDLTYVLFCTIAVASIYLSAVGDRSVRYTILSGVFLLVAFFTKGPPVLIIYISGVCSLVLVDRIKPGTLGRRLSGGWIGAYAAILVCLAALTAAWMTHLAGLIGWREVRSIFSTEVLVRFIQDVKADERGRGTFFYIGSLIRGFAPWTFLLLGLAVTAGRTQVAEKFRRNRGLVIFCAGIIVPSLIIFSAASGKSNRYLFPLYPFLAPLLALCAAGLPAVVRPDVVRRLVALAGAAAAGLVAGLALGLDMLPFSGRLLAAAVTLGSGLGVYLQVYRKGEANWIRIAAVFTVWAVLSRLPFSIMFDGVRNRTYSIRPTAAAIEKQIPAGEPVYVAELFERWLPYYMKRDGINTLRLTPEIAAEMAGRPGDFFLLLNDDYEGWRKAQLERGGAAVEELGRYRSAKSDFVLLKVPQTAAKLLEPKPVFAAVPTRPS